MRLKKTLSLFLSVIMAGSAFCGTGAYAAADFVAEEKMADLTFESGVEGFSTHCVKQSENLDEYHGKALEFFPISSTTSSAKIFSTAVNERSVVSFDFKAKQTDHIFRMVFLDDSTTTPFASIYWDHAGRLLFSLDGSVPTGITATGTYSLKQSIVPYDAEKWHNISAVITPDGDDTTISYYYDGKLVADSNVSALAGKYPVSGKFKSIYMASTQTGYGAAETLEYDGSEALYIDNIQVVKDIPEFYANAEYKEEYIKVDFSEQYSAEYYMTDAELYDTSTGALVEADVYTEPRSIYITPKNELSSYREYAVKLPDGLKSALGKDAYSEYVYFTAPKNFQSTGGELSMPYVFSADFENLSEGTAANAAPWSGIIDGGSINGVSCSEIAGNKVVSYKSTENANALKFSAKTGRTTRWNESADFDSAVIKLDVSRNKEKRSTDFITFVSNFPAGQCFFDSYGHFVMVDGISADTLVADLEREDCDGDCPDNYIVYNMPLDETGWCNLTIVVDKIGKEISYYIDDDLAGTCSYINEAAAPQVTELRLLAYGGDSREILLDNFVVAHFVTSENVSKIRYYDRNGEAFGPLAQDVPSTASGGKITFSTNIDDTTVGENTIEIGNEEITIDRVLADSIEFSFVNFLRRNEPYSVKISGVKTANGEVMKDYTSSFHTSPTKEIVVENFAIKRGSSAIETVSQVEAGDEITLTGTIVNATDAPVHAFPVINVINDGVIKDSIMDSITVGSNSTAPVNVSIIVDNIDKLELSAMIIDEHDAPITDKISITDSVGLPQDDWTVSYEGQIASRENAKTVFVEVLLPGKSRADVTAGNINTTLAYRGQTVTGADGKFTVAFRLFDDLNVSGDAVSGSYPVKIGCAGGDGYNDVIRFSNINEAQSLIAEVNRTVSNDSKIDAINNLKSIIKNNKEALKLSKDNYADTYADNMSLMLYDYVKNTAAVSGIDDAENIINRLAVIQKIVAGDSDNLFSYSDILNISASDIGAFCSDSFMTEAFQKSVTAALKNKAVETVSDFYDVLTENFVLEAVKAPDGAANVQKILIGLYSKIGIDLQKAQAAPINVYNNISNKAYTSYSQLAEAFNSAYAASNRLVVSSPSGGGGGSAVSTISVGAGTQTQSSVAEPIPLDIFNDIDSVEWAKDAIITLAEKKVISGKGNNMFCPNDNITREEFVKMIADAFLKSESVDMPVVFIDVAKDKWSYPYIAKAFGAGLVSGYTDTWFGATDNITRQDMAVVLYRAAVISEKSFLESEEKTFADKDNIAEYALEATTKLYNSGIISGISDNEFGGTLFATRAQAAKMIYELLKM